MQLSAFNLYVDGYPAAGQTLVHNTFSGAYAILDRAELDGLKAAEHEARPDARALCDELGLDDPHVGVLVPSRAQEQREYDRWFQERCKGGSVLQSIVCINLACNFECPYCCQADVMDGSVMDRDTMARTADWLAARAREVGARGVHVSFVGGEPLLHPDRIAALASRIRGGLGDGVPFSMGLITNGYFLTEDVVLELVEHGLCSAKVTLDGDGTTHHLSRVSKKGEDTFQRIFDNVVAASRHIDVVVNGNYQESTIAGFGPLVAKLAEAGLPEGTRITFSPALEILGAPRGGGSGSCTWSGSAYQYQVALYDEVLRHGFEAKTPLQVGPCAFHDRHMYAIDPVGRIYKCPGFLGHPEWRIGDVEGGLTARYEQMASLDTQRGCGGCAHRPSCAGGCVAHEFIRRGEAEGVNCEREFFEAMARDVVIRDYLLASSDSVDEALRAFPEPPLALPEPVAAAGSGRGVRSAALRVL